jgi:hypothetical protein
MNTILMTIVATIAVGALGFIGWSLLLLRRQQRAGIDMQLECCAQDNFFPAQRACREVADHDASLAK